MERLCIFCKLLFIAVILAFCFSTKGLGEDFDQFEIKTVDTKMKNTFDFSYIRENADRSPLECKYSYKVAVVFPLFDTELNQVLFGIFTGLTYRKLMNFPMHNDKQSFFDHDYQVQLEDLNKTSCITLVNNWFYGNYFNEANKKKIKNEIFERVKKKEITMIIGMGSIVGSDFIEPSWGIPILIADGDPEKIGIKEPRDFSNIPNVHIQWAKNYYEDSMKYYDNILNIKTFGMLSDFHSNMKQIQLVDKIKKIAEDLGFKFLNCETDLMEPRKYVRYGNIDQCISYFIKNKADAVFFPSYSRIEPNEVNIVIQPLIEEDIITISEDVELVEYGTMISAYDANLFDAGRYEAHVIEKLVQGMKVSEISQVYVPNFKLAVNTNTAQKVEWNPSYDILMQIEELY